MIGKYLRGEAMPYIEAAKKIANAFKVSLDYLVGKGVHASYDKKTVKHLQDIEKLNTSNKEHLFAFMDVFFFKRDVQKSLGKTRK